MLDGLRVFDKRLEWMFDWGVLRRLLGLMDTCRIDLRWN